jgi:hypothetical protein
LRRMPCSSTTVGCVGYIPGGIEFAADLAA